MLHARARLDAAMRRGGHNQGASDEEQYYAAHSDFTVEPGYDRVATFLIYLSDAHDGGETVFPYLRATTDASKAAEGQVTYVWNKQPDYRAMTCDAPGG